MSCRNATMNQAHLPALRIAASYGKISTNLFPGRRPNACQESLLFAVVSAAWSVADFRMESKFVASQAGAQFTWRTIDVTADLPVGWQESVMWIAQEYGRDRAVGAPSLTSRELPGGADLLISMVDGTGVELRLPWLAALYAGRFRDLAQLCTEEAVVTARDPRYGIYLNVQTARHGRTECHVDSNPIEGLLYFTDQPRGFGGELRVSNAGEVRGTDEVDRDCASIYPVAGHLVFFDARRHTHYVTALAREDDLRVVAGMNYYVPSVPESARPADLNERLFGAK